MQEMNSISSKPASRPASKPSFGAKKPSMATGNSRAHTDIGEPSAAYTSASKPGMGKPSFAKKPGVSPMTRPRDAADELIEQEMGGGMMNQ